MSTHHEVHRIGPGVPGVASPEVEAPTTTPGPPETRDNHNIIGNHETSRRSLLMGLLGIGGALAVGGGGAAILLDNQRSRHTFDGAPPEVATTPSERSPDDFGHIPKVFERELRLTEIVPPESLDPPTWEQAFANIGQAIQYAVNHNDMALLAAVIPGVQNGADVTAVQPGQLAMRAAYIKQYREVYGGDKPADNPDNTLHYAWGFTMQLLELVSSLGDNIDRATSVRGLVRVTVGDYRPVEGGPNRVQIEYPQTYEREVILTRIKNMATGAKNPNHGWSAYRLDMPRIPEVIATTPPRGFTTVPPLYY